MELSCLCANLVLLETGFSTLIAPPAAGKGFIVATAEAVVTTLVIGLGAVPPFYRYVRVFTMIGRSF